MWVLSHSTCFAEREAAYLETFSSDINALVQSKSKHIPEKFCLHGSLTEAYLDSLSGIMSKPSEPITQIHEATLNGSEKGVGNSSFVAGSRSCARIFPQQEKAQESKVSAADCGKNSQGSFARYDPATRSLKTAQCSLFADSIQSSLILPRWGSMRNGGLFQQKIPALYTSENASGFWPTQNVAFGGNTGPLTMNGNHFVRRSGKKAHLCLDQAVKMWATPLARDSRTVRGGARAMSAIGSEPLITQVAEAESMMDGRLNPEWVEWLMGWPAQWTELKPLETVKFQEFVQSHSISYLGDSNERN